MAAVAGLLAAVTSGAHAQGSDTAAEIEKYRQALADGNPAELWEARGEAMWKEPRGPKKAPLTQCDLGMGPGVVKGAYAHLPRYFADTGRVMDLETRIFHCMSTLQGISEAESHKVLFGGPGHRADIEALTAYVTSESKGTVINVSLSDPHMKSMYAIGEQIFFYRGGPHDFACATCHGEDNKRIRLQDLPDLTQKQGAQKAYSTWPAYRVSQGELRTMQWRLNDCFRQQRFPDLVYGSPTSIALTTYLAYNANGAVYDGPGLKR
ncbi:MAG: sulfur oxidation c-type cytochrome SoxA [Casimicrobiaceae bacterium]